MVRQYVGAANFVINLFKGTQKTTGTGAIDKVNISKNLKEFQKHKDEIIKSTDKYTKGLTDEGKIKVKTTVSPALSKLSKITQKKPQFNKGGRVGLKRGTGLMKKKSNVQKIKETFGPKNKSTKFGMLSVKAGIDKNPNPTQADRIAGAKMKSKKRFV